MEAAKNVKALIKKFFKRAKLFFVSFRQKLIPFKGCLIFSLSLDNFKPAESQWFHTFAINSDYAALFPQHLSLDVLSVRAMTMFVGGKIFMLHSLSQWMKARKSLSVIIFPFTYCFVSVGTLWLPPPPPLPFPPLRMKINLALCVPLNRMSFRNIIHLMVSIPSHW